MSPGCARVLAALKQGAVAQPDFLLPNTIDGGKPITRLAARIRDLRDEFGDDFIRDLPGRRGGCKLYALADCGTDVAAAHDLREAA